MKTITIQDFQLNFDYIINCVERGESFLIKSQYGDAMMVPHKKYEEMDDLIRIYKDHEEGS